MSEYDLVIRGGSIVDGSGGPTRVADVGVRNGCISAIEPKLAGRGREELDASGLLVTPGFIDVHTHYDGQAAWDTRLQPSSNHGVTTVVMGNCGVGFAPCRPTDRDALIALMEGVEDIPGSALAEGLPWNWESFADYLDALDALPRDIDVAALVPHAPLRVYVMGERAIAREPAAERDIAEMQRLLAAALDAGGVGFSTSRTMVHRTPTGEFIPTYQAAATELKRLGEALKDQPAAVFQMISDFDDAEEEFDILRHVSRVTGRKSTFTLLHGAHRPDFCPEQLARVDQAQREGLEIHPQVLSRPLGMLMGLEASLIPFSARPSYKAIAHLPLAERVRRLRDPDLKRKILGEQDENPHIFLSAIAESYQRVFPFVEPVEYMPAPDQSITAIAARENMDPAAWLYDWLLTNEGRSLLYIPAANYTDLVEDMLRHQASVPALGDGGAHVASICDASATTWLLTRWVKERGAFTVEEAISMLTKRPAELYGFSDRGLLVAGMKADINVIDLDRLTLKLPTIVADLPAGGRRFLQAVEGYCATIVAGEVVYRDGHATGHLPGRLVRRSSEEPQRLTRRLRM